jgi:hypothetical protein
MEVRITMYLPTLKLEDTFNTNGYQSRLAAEINIDVHNLEWKCASTATNSTTAAEIYYLAKTLHIKYIHYQIFNNPVQFDEKRVLDCLERLMATLVHLIPQP